MPCLDATGLTQIAPRRFDQEVLCCWSPSATSYEMSATCSRAHQQHTIGVSGFRAPTAKIALFICLTSARGGALFRRHVHASLALSLRSLRRRVFISDYQQQQRDRTRRRRPPLHLLSAKEGPALFATSSGARDGIEFRIQNNEAAGATSSSGFNFPVAFSLYRAKHVTKLAKIG